MVQDKTCRVEEARFELDENLVVQGTAASEGIRKRQLVSWLRVAFHGATGGGCCLWDGGTRRGHFFRIIMS